MPGNNHTYIAPGVFYCKASCGNIVVMHIGNCSLLLNPGACELLVGYLKVIKAYFAVFKNRREIIKGYYGEIATQLNRRENTIGLKDISLVIHELGCISDWQHLHENPE